MKPQSPLIIAVSTLAITFVVSQNQARAQVLPLDFTGGFGNTQVDQFVGVSGSGWSSAWSQGYGTGTSSGLGSVIDTSPLYSGGGNYLHVTYDTAAGAAADTRWARVSRQWNTSALSLTSPIVLDFYLRPDVAVSNGTQSFVIFGSSAATNTTGGNDSWKMQMDGGGLSVYNNNTITALMPGAIAANTPLHFTLTIDPLADTYVVQVVNLNTSMTYTSAALALRNGADSSLSYINFVANGGAGQTNIGYSVDSLSVVPEPGALALGLVGASLLFFHRARRRASVEK